jgi:hypothetical protein
MMRAALCVIERFLFGFGTICSLFLILFVVMWVSSKVRLQLPERLSGILQSETCGLVTSIIAGIAIGGVIAVGCYLLGTDIAHSLGLCRMQK